MRPLNGSKPGGFDHTNNNYLTVPMLEDSITNRSSSGSAAIKLLRNLNALRRRSLLCDVEITVGSSVILAHRAVLAASSPYFNAMFTGYLCEKDQPSVELHQISSHILKVLIDFIYTGEVEISQGNVQEVMVAADMLELEDVIVMCSEFLIHQLHAVNAVGIYRFAELHNFMDLKTSAMHFIQTHFAEVSHEDELCDLPKDRMVELLASEHLRVESESQVFHSAVRWIGRDILNRRRYVFEILRHVRLSVLPVGLLERAIVECDDSSLRIALRSIHSDLTSRKGCLVPLDVHPRLGSKKHIFVIGGSKREADTILNKGFECNYVTVEKFDTFTREWLKAAPLTVSRIVPGVALLDSSIYVFGGEHGSTSLACGERYRTTDDCWSPVASMLVPRCAFGLCAWRSRLYAVGGWVGGDRESIGGSIERYDPERDEWSLVGTLPQPRFSMGVVAYENLIYMVGGCTENQRFLSDLLSYDPLTGQWNSLSSMSVARSQMGVTILGDYLYVVGGTNRSQVLDSVERYSFKKRKWSTIPPMLIGRSGPSVAAVDGLLYVIGGYKTHENPFYRAQFTVASVECFDPSANAWTDCPSLPESRAEAGAVIL